MIILKVYTTDGEVYEVPAPYGFEQRCQELFAVGFINEQTEFPYTKTAYPPTSIVKVVTEN